MSPLIRMILAGFFLFCGKAFPICDLVAPFTVDLKGSSALFDTLEITTYFTNRGNSVTKDNSQALKGFLIGLDTFTVLRSHDIPAHAYLNANSFIEYKDTLVIIQGEFSIHTWVDPIGVYEDVGYSGNNVRSQAYNFHPTIQHVHDTVVIYDTLRIHDTTKITVRDTIKYCPSGAKIAASNTRPLAQSVVYSVAGEKIWEGLLPLGDFPPSKLDKGFYLIVQNQNVRRFRVAYR